MALRSFYPAIVSLALLASCAISKAFGIRITNDFRIISVKDGMLRNGKLTNLPARQEASTLYIRGGGGDTGGGTCCCATCLKRQAQNGQSGNDAASERGMKMAEKWSELLLRSPDGGSSVCPICLLRRPPLSSCPVCTTSFPSPTCSKNHASAQPCTASKAEPVAKAPQRRAIRVGRTPSRQINHPKWSVLL